jgi:hypothetical protein
VTDTDDEIKLTPRTERANVRVNQDYQCPSVSKPLPNIWMPAYIARLVEEEEEEGDVDSAGQSIHSRHSVMESGKWTSINELNRDQ